MNFDLLIQFPRVVRGWGSVGKKLATMLLHFYATLFCVEKVDLRPIGPIRRVGDGWEVCRQIICYHIDAFRDSL